MLATWPPVLETLLRRVQIFLSFFGKHRLVGIPLDLLIRFAGLGGVYLLLRIRMDGKRAVLLCASVLLASEVLGSICIEPLYYAPDWGDLVDVISGLAGIAAAEGLRRIRRRHA